MAAPFAFALTFDPAQARNSFGRLEAFAGASLANTPWAALPRCFSLHGDIVSTAGRATSPIAEAFGVEFELRDRAAQSVAVHAKLARGLALITIAVLQDRKNEFLLEFANGFGVSDAASIHLYDKCFQLIFHDASLRL